MKQWIDISQRLDEQVATWPGDTPFSYQLNWTKQQSGSVNVGQLTMSIHTGTHVDAPFHFNDTGKRIIDTDLDRFIGPARVVSIPGTTSIGVKDMKNFDLSGTTRLIIHTGAWEDKSVFPQTIPPIEPDLAAYLSEIGIKLLGLDLPSVDPLDSKELLAHHALATYDIQILEGLVLEHVPPGDYELIALPLPISQADGSPVRAVVRPLS